jgi:hypothetical protein
MHTLGFGDQA